MGVLPISLNSDLLLEHTLRDWDDHVASVYIDDIIAWKDHESGTVTVEMDGHTPACNEQDYPAYLGSFQILIEYGNGGYMRTAQFRFADLKHDGGLSASHFQFVGPFSGMYDYNPDQDCGLATVTIFDDACGHF